MVHVSQEYIYFVAYQGSVLTMLVNFSNYAKADGYWYKFSYCKELAIMWMGIRGSSSYPVCKKRIERVNKVLYISFRGSTTRKESPAVV